MKSFQGNSKAKPHFEIDTHKLERLKSYKEKLKNKFPKFGIFIISYNASNLLAETLDRVSIELYNLIEEVYIFDDHSTDNTLKIAKDLRNSSKWKNKLQIYGNPRNLGYGGNQKVGYKYAIDKGFDYVIMIHGDGQYAPEFLPDLMLPVIENKAEIVFGSRMLNRKNALKGGMPLYKWIGNQVLTTFENLILGTKLSEFHSGYRLYSTNVLKNIPFEQNTNVFHFDTQIIVQCRALNIHIHEVPIKTFYGEEVCNVNGIKYAIDVCTSVLEYRLHQLHILRKGRYIIGQDDIKYTRKYGRFSSHELILKRIQKPGIALDLGSSSGLLTHSLLNRKVESVCVDILDEKEVNIPCKSYYQANLENPEALTFKREFDYIILADIIEHLRNAPGLLKTIQKFVKEDGKIILSVPNIAIWFYRLSLLIGRFNYGPKGTLDETHVRFYTLSTLKQLLNKAGLTICDIRPTSLPFEVVFESIGKSKILKLLDSFYYKFAKLWPSLFAYQFVIEAQINSFESKEGEGSL